MADLVHKLWVYFNTFHCKFILQNYFEFLKTKFENIDDLSQVVLQSKQLSEVVHLTRLLGAIFSLLLSDAKYSTS